MLNEISSMELYAVLSCSRNTVQKLNVCLLLQLSCCHDYALQMHQSSVLQWSTVLLREFMSSSALSLRGSLMDFTSCAFLQDKTTSTCFEIDHPCNQVRPFPPSDPYKADTFVTVLFSLKP